MDTPEIQPLMLSYVVQQLQFILAGMGDMPVYAGHLGESEVSVKAVLAGHNSNFQETVFLELIGIRGMAHPGTSSGDSERGSQGTAPIVGQIPFSTAA